MADQTGAAAPWYTSSVQIAHLVTAISALIALSPRIGNFIGGMMGKTTPITTADLQQWVETIAGFVALVSPIVGSFFRARSKLQPLTLTQAGADAHPATIAMPDFVATQPIPVKPPAPGHTWGT